MQIKRLQVLAILAGAFAALFAAPLGAQDLVLSAIPLSGSAGPLVDPDAAYWRDAPAIKVEMLPQNITNPQNPDPAVKELNVRAAHNGQWLAFLIEWADPTKSDRIVVDQFGDQVAVEMPSAYKPGDMPNPMMGAPGERMHIMQWRAAFQHDIETSGEPKISDLYPYIHVDVYPDEVLRATDARAYTGAVGVDNPISRPKRSAVLDQMAEGFGTLTVEPEQQSDGRGIWADGRWRVVITHPMAPGDPNDPSLGPGDQTLAAFAVWEGGAREVGARKAWSNWVQLKVETGHQ
ncbi:MAG TPA: ethylbenzene dehydrogenase-related protein [Hyphomicrobiaceae bacterium]|nr:ethylbenzene dehydrogenase-related protein [Hyphomicrobiaceae bacterium]